MIVCEELICKLTSHWMKEKDPFVYDYTGIIDANGIIRYVSMKQQLVTGWQPSDLIGQSVFQFINPKSVQSVLSKLKEMTTTNKPSEFHLKIRSKDGEWVSICSEKIPIVSHDRTIGFVALCRKSSLSHLMKDRLQLC